MSRKKSGLTLVEHKALGANLRQVRDILHSVHLTVGTKYPHGSKVSKRADKVIKAFSKLRSELDHRLFAEHPSINETTGKRIYSTEPEPDPASPATTQGEK